MTLKLNPKLKSLSKTHHRTTYIDSRKVNKRKFGINEEKKDKTYKKIRESYGFNWESSIKSLQRTASKKSFEIQKEEKYKDQNKKVKS